MPHEYSLPLSAQATPPPLASTAPHPPPNPPSPAHAPQKDSIAAEAQPRHTPETDVLARLRSADEDVVGSAGHALADANEPAAATAPAAAEAEPHVEANEATSLLLNEMVATVERLNEEGSDRQVCLLWFLFSSYSSFTTVPYKVAIRSV